MESVISYAALALIVLAAIVSLVFRERRVRERRAFSGTIIKNPVLGALNLEGSSADDTVEEDLLALRPYFSAVQRSDDVPPVCDVLLLYCEFYSSGALKSSSKDVREIIRDAGAKIVVFATNNPFENYGKAPFGRANLIMTVDRKGPLFANFLARLFAQMHNGVSMPMAWISLSHQHPHTVQNPEAGCLIEHGQVIFAFKPPIEESTS